MKSFSTFLLESNAAEDNPYHETLTLHGYKPAGSMRSASGAEHTYKRKGSKAVTLKGGFGSYSWTHQPVGSKAVTAYGPTKLNNHLHLHNGTGEHIHVGSDE